MPVAINPVQRPQQIREEKKDPLDTILKGLQVAVGVAGIVEGRDKIKQLEAQRADQAKDRQANQAAQEADLLAKGFKKDVDDKGVVTFLRPPGYEDLGAKKTRADIAKTEAETKHILSGKGKDPDTQGLTQLIKAQQAQLQGFQLAEAQKKAGEIEGPKALAATYGRRMEEADRIMGQLNEQGFDRSSVGAAFDSKLPGFAQGGQIKQQQQAERNFLNAVLRRESGAAISPSEFSSGEEQYFDRAGDSAEVKAQKAQNRAQAIAGLRAEAGHAWDKVPIAVAPTVGLRAPKGSQFSNSARADQGQINGKSFTIEAPKQGMTKEWQGVTYRVVGDKWVPDK